MTRAGWWVWLSGPRNWGSSSSRSPTTTTRGFRPRGTARSCGRCSGRWRAPPSASGFGEQAVRLAARIGDGYWGNAPDRDVIELYENSGGSGPRYAQLDLCWAEDVAAARKTVHEVWPNGGIPGQLSQDLPTWTHFE